MALNQLLRHIQMVAEHAERAFQTKHLINESAKRALKSSKKDLMVVPKKNRGKIENTAPTTKLEKIKKFAGWKVMMERYTIEGEEIMVGNKKKKQEKLTLPRENEGLGGFTFLYQPTPTSPTVMYAVLTE